MGGQGFGILVATVLTLSFAVGCSPASSSHGVFQVQDSAGIMVATNRGNTTAMSGSAVVMTEEVTISLGERFGLRALLPLSDTTLLVGMGGLISVDLKTGETKSAGGVGDGPGEYGGVMAIGRCAGDSILVQSHPARMSTLDPDWRFVRRVDRPVLRIPLLGFASDCDAVLAVSLDPLPSVSGRRVVYPQHFFWYAPEADSRSPVVSVPSAERGLAELYGQEMPLALPYGNLPSSASSGDLVYVGTGNLPEIRVYSRSGGLVQIVRWEATPERVDAPARAAYDQVRQRLDEQFGQGVSADFPPASAFALPSHKPLYMHIVISDNGQIWVRRYPDVWEGFERIFRVSFSGQAQEWWVFSPKGRLLGLFSTPPHYFVHAIARGKVFALRRDSDDMEYLAALPLAAPLRGDTVGTQ